MGRRSIGQKNMIILLISTLAVYFFMHFFFNITLPFLLAFLTIWKVYPGVSKLSKKIRCKEIWIITFSLLFFLAIIIGVLYVPIENCFDSISILPKDTNFIDYQFFETCVEKYKNIKKVCCEYVGEDTILKIQTGAINSVKFCIEIITYIVVYFVSVLLICKDFPQIKMKIQENRENIFIKIITGVVLYLKAFFKTQVIIFLILSILIGTILSILKVPYGWLVGLITGFMDALPFIGTGIVLVPLTIYFFIKGEIIKGIVVLILYGTCTLIRELLEPKLIGKKVGIFPIILFASVFIGMKIFGVGGIIKGPLSVVIIYEIRKVLLANEEKV